MIINVSIFRNEFSFRNLEFASISRFIATIDFESNQLLINSMKLDLTYSCSLKMGGIVENELLNLIL